MGNWTDDSGVSDVGDQIDNRNSSNNSIRLSPSLLYRAAAAGLCGILMRMMPSAQQKTQNASQVSPEAFVEDEGLHLAPGGCH
ncbi:hypothetical protein STEG23_010326 [Scotinomys teguina]